MKNISDLDFRRVSSFIDGELDQNEVKILLKDKPITPANSQKRS